MPIANAEVYTNPQETNKRLATKPRSLRIDSSQREEHESNRQFHGQLPDPVEIPAILGTLPMGMHTINGEEWYSFSTLRDGTIDVSATGTGALSAHVYDASYRLKGSSSASGSRSRLSEPSM